MQSSTKHIKQYKNKQKNKKEALITKKERAKEQRERITRCESQVLDQSKRDLQKRASNWSSNLSMSSKVRRLRSLQIHHIKHNGTKFQM